jgi:hypothetical protein
MANKWKVMMRRKWNNDNGRNMKWNNVPNLLV